MQQAPKFHLAQVGSEQSCSLDAFKNKIVMLTFWTTWCPDSKRDLFAKHRLFQSLNSKEVVLLMINVTGRERKVDLKSFLEEHQFRFPVLMDEGTKVYDAYHCMGVPTTVLLNRNHQIVASYNDKSTFIEIMKGLSTLL